MHMPSEVDFHMALGGRWVEPSQIRRRLFGAAFCDQSREVTSTGGDRFGPEAAITETVTRVGRH